MHCGLNPCLSALEFDVTSLLTRIPPVFDAAAAYLLSPSHSSAPGGHEGVPRQAWGEIRCELNRLIEESRLQTPGRIFEIIAKYDHR